MALPRHNHQQIALLSNWPILTSRFLTRYHFHKKKKRHFAVLWLSSINCHIKGNNFLLLNIWLWPLRKFSPVYSYVYCNALTTIYLFEEQTNGVLTHLMVRLGEARFWGKVMGQGTKGSYIMAGGEGDLFSLYVKKNGYIDESRPTHPATQPPSHPATHGTIRSHRWSHREFYSWIAVINAHLLRRQNLCNRDARWGFAYW